MRFYAICGILDFFRTLNNFRFIWNEFRLGFPCGLAYTTDKSELKNLSQVIKLLNTQSYISLMQGQPMLLSPLIPVDNIVSKAVIRHELQKSIDRQSFVLMAQPILSITPVIKSLISKTGITCYYEILVRMNTSDGNLLFLIQYCLSHVRPDYYLLLNLLLLSRRYVLCSSTMILYLTPVFQLI